MLRRRPYLLESDRKQQPGVQGCKRKAFFQEAISTLRENQNLASKQTIKVRTKERCDSNLTLEPREGQKQGEEAEREVLEQNIS